MIKRYFVKTHQGPILKVNEDGVIVDPNMGLFAVIDAFGGVGIGDEYVQFLKQEIPKGISSNQSDPDRTLNFYFDPLRPLEVNALINLLLDINARSIENNKKKSLIRRAGASVSLGLQVGDVMHFISIGTGTINLLRNEQIVEILPSAHFSMFPDELPARFKDDNLRVVKLPRTALGLNHNLEIQWSPLKLLKKDIIFICSDGVLLDTDLQSLLRSIPEHASQTPTLQKIVEKAFDHSNIRGNVDNQTMLLLEY